MFSENNKIEDYIVRRLSNYSLILFYQNKDIEIQTPEDDLYNVLSFLHHDTHCQFEQLVDLIVLDDPDCPKRFTLVYIVRSLKHNQQVRISTRVTSEIDSVSEIYKNASWLEREAWEMFGVFFKKNRDLRRLLTSFLIGGHPLEKNYPSTGFMDYIFDKDQNKFFSAPLLLSPQKRTFETRSVWNRKSDALSFSQDASLSLYNDEGNKEGIMKKEELA